MGRRSDPGAVLDSRFRVHGTQGLRVVDASVFPRIPGFFIVTAIYMAAEKASAAILADATNRVHPPSRPVFPRLPHPRKPAHPTAVQEFR
jgi:choline dehydrogenase